MKRPNRNIRTAPIFGRQIDITASPIEISIGARYASVPSRRLCNSGAHQRSWKFSSTPQKAQRHGTIVLRIEAVQPIFYFAIQYVRVKPGRIFSGYAKEAVFSLLFHVISHPL